MPAGDRTQAGRGRRVTGGIAAAHRDCSRMLADLLGLMRLRRYNREPFYSLEVAVAADENSA